jgi:hypothetical protein
MSLIMEGIAAMIRATVRMAKNMRVKPNEKPSAI